MWKQRADIAIAQSACVLPFLYSCFYLLVKVLTVEPYSYLDLIFFPQRPPEAWLLYNSSGKTESWADVGHTSPALVYAPPHSSAKRDNPEHL